MTKLSIIFVLALIGVSDISGMKRSDACLSTASGSQSTTATIDFAQVPNDVVWIFVALSNYRNVLRLVSRQFHRFASYPYWKELVRNHERIVYISPMDRDRLYAQLITSDNVDVMRALLKTDGRMIDYIRNKVISGAPSPLTYRNPANMVPLAYAHSFQMTKLLVEHGASADHMVFNDHNQNLPVLWNAILQADTPSVKLFLDNKVFSAQNLMERNHEGKDALGIAVEHGCYDIALLLLQSGYDVSQECGVLLQAASSHYQNHSALAELLLDHGFDPDGHPDDDYKPLYGFIESGDVDLITKCVRSGANLEVWDGYIDNRIVCTPLCHAISIQSPTVVRTLLDLGANPANRVNDDDDEEELPLDMAKRLGNQEIIDMIIHKMEGSIQ